MSVATTTASEEELEDSQPLVSPASESTPDQSSAPQEEEQAPVATAEIIEQNGEELVLVFFMVEIHLFLFSVLCEQQKSKSSTI